jgi:adenylate cyclase
VIRGPWKSRLVENSSRLVTKEELFKTVWPNVVVSDDVLTQCVSEVRHAIGDGDQKIIKTVPRRGYRFAASVSRIGPDSEAAPQKSAVSDRAQAHSGAAQQLERLRTDRPCVAVLPFANLSGDTQQEYFSDGITADIITELSRFSELLIIARNSTFQYKGKAFDVRHVGRELGARYVLEGSIRRDRDRVRINAQLIDATTGAHRWAERYDRKLTDVFAVQDDVARTIVAILAAHVIRAETERVLLKPPAAWEAYDYYLRGAQAYFLHLTRRTSASLYDARRLFEQSLSIDPDYARAYGMLSFTYVHTYLEPLDDDYHNLATLDRAHELATMAVHLDAYLPEAHAHLGWVLLWRRQHETAIAEFERAFALNPNFIDDRFSCILATAGEPERAVEVLQANMCLDPFPHPRRLGYLGHAYYMLRRYHDSVRELREYASRSPKLQISRVWLAAAYAQSGQLDNAGAEAAEVMRINPGFTIANWKSLGVYKNPDDADHLLDGLGKAGLPEG